MNLDKESVRNNIATLGFAPQDMEDGVYFKKYNNYLIKIDFNKNKILYGNLIQLGDHTTSNFSQNENFVVLECVDRLLEKGYPPPMYSS